LADLPPRYPDMKDSLPSDLKAAVVRMQRDLVDAYDEDFELELAEDALDPRHDGTRKAYFRELFRLQGELVRLQDWVVAARHRMVILFEGRDAAGKGGVIKRITQRLNPRVCRTVALPAPNDRERTHWYFQRYVAHLPAAGEIVPDLYSNLGVAAPANG